MGQLNQVLFHQAHRVGANLNGWLAGVGGQALEKALAEPQAIITMAKEGDLRGLGGSGFPTYKKWELLAAQPNNGRDKYLICNGNEDEPGTFKDDILLCETPHQIIEGATITALACGINRIVFYINPDKHEAIETMHRAVDQWKTSEWFGRVQEALGKPLEYRVLPSSGHYIGGEETAAIETVEGKFPFPRGKPPYPSEYGVHGCPTLINNMETMANVSHLLRNGAEWFRGLGHGEATGTKIYCLTGDVLYPGAYELPMGTPLSTLINEYGGGMLLDKKLKAVFTGGPSNTILTPKDLDVPLDYESVRERHSSLGTGAMIVISEGTGIVKRVTEYVNFFAHSSCGQCPPCKTGTFYAAMLLNKLDTGQGNRADLEALVNLVKILPNAGKCHLLDGALKVLESSLYHFRDEYEEALVRQ